MKKTTWLLCSVLSGLVSHTLIAKPQAPQPTVPQEEQPLEKLIPNEEPATTEPTTSTPKEDVPVADNQATTQPPVKTSTGDSNRTPFDWIKVRVNGANILQSALTEPRIAKEGKPFTLDEAIFEELLIQRATEMQMIPKAPEVERYITSFKIQNNLTELSEQEFEDQLKQSGFSLKQYKQQIARMIATENVKRAEISEKVVITAQEVEEYYNKHPQFTKDVFHIQTSTHTDGKPGAWQDLGWIKKKDLSKEFECVLNMQPGEISAPITNANGKEERIKLVEKKAARRKTLDEQYASIERKLQNEKKKNFLGEFEKELKAKATIVYL